VFRNNLILKLKFVIVVNDDNCEKKKKKMMMMMIMMIRMIIILPCPCVHHVHVGLTLILFCIFLNVMASIPSPETEQPELCLTWFLGFHETSILFFIFHSSYHWPPYKARR
jgi:hypothetical protein